MNDDDTPDAPAGEAGHFTYEAFCRTIKAIENSPQCSPVYMDPALARALGIRVADDGEVR
ncbi:hypothetical protein [Streptomyces sp. NPDC086182]|jgi:hypothetical protein|uniref:hypothetical protein n=1 Tax=Streptomyces sp. NPDC086182 TaxID=3155058 RepID=UPI00342AE0D2